MIVPDKISDEIIDILRWASEQRGVDRESGDPKIRAEKTLNATVQCVLFDGGETAKDRARVATNLIINRLDEAYESGRAVEAKPPAFRLDAMRLLHSHRLAGEPRTLTPWAGDGVLSLPQGMALQDEPEVTQTEKKWWQK